MRIFTTTGVFRNDVGGRLSLTRDPVRRAGRKQIPLEAGGCALNPDLPNQPVEATGANAEIAVAAFARYRGRPAKLNMGDCFAYALAQAANAPLLYKGSDFAKTDVQSA
jgi:uncharacterized protein with PIN domain